MDTEAYAKDFIAVMKSKLEGRNLDDVLNIEYGDTDPVLIPLQHDSRSERITDSTFPCFNHGHEAYHSCRDCHGKLEDADTLPRLQG